MTERSEQVAIITGASSGIGEAAALALAAKGGKLILAARRADRLKELSQRVKDAGGQAVPVTCDVVDRGQVARVVETARKEFGRIDILINNAGIMPLAPMAKCRMDDWDAEIDVNIKGLLYGIGCALPIMLEQKTGHIINVSSVAGRLVFPNAAVYCGTKHAVHAISDGLRSELAEQSKEDGNRIRVTVIAPGVVATELTGSVRDEESRKGTEGFYHSFKQPLLSEDIAASILYAIEAPPHVDINEILIRPVEQAL